MKVKSISKYFGCLALLAAIVCLPSLNIKAQVKAEKQNRQRELCSDNNYSWGNKVSFNELRETTLSAGNLLTVDGKRNGGISVRGSNRSDVLVRACIQARGATEEEARAIARSVRIETNSVVRAEGTGDESNWAVSYEILVPRSTNLKLATQNGGISINSVEGALDFEAQNGGVSLRDSGGDVKGKTMNGGVNVELSGGGWKGGGLDVQTTNGGVHLSLPESYAAHIEAGTVNGGFQSEIGGLSIDRSGNRARPSRISADLNGGGATVRVITTNGGVKISSAGKFLNL